MNTDTSETLASNRAVFTAPHASALAGCRERKEHEPNVEAALRAQLDRVLEEIWSVAEADNATAGNNLPLAQLAMRLCALYPQSTPAHEERVALGALSLELHGSDVHADGQRVRLTRRESEVLRYLLLHRGRVISRYELLDEIWQGRDGSSPRARWTSTSIACVPSSAARSRSGSRPCTTSATSCASRLRPRAFSACALQTPSKLSLLARALLPVAVARDQHVDQRAQRSADVGAARIHDPRGARRSPRPRSRAQRAPGSY